MKSKFEIFKDRIGQFRFCLKAGNGEIILVSEGYTSKQNCFNGVASVRMNSQFDHRFERAVASNGMPYFNLRATNGQVIGTSQLYSSKQARDKGIQSVKEGAARAEVISFLSRFL